MRIKEVGYIVERLADRFRDLGGQMAAQEADHKTALEELRAGFNARTASDEHRLENLREEIIRLNDANGRLVVERDTLREEVAHLKTQLKSQTKHPVKVGAYVKRLTGFNTTPAGEIGRVTRVDDDADAELEYEVKRPNGETGVWCAKNCEPCDPPEATHETPEGRSVAESVIRDDRKTEPKPGVEVVTWGDLVEVYQATGNFTYVEDVGARGVVTTIVPSDKTCRLRPVEGYKAAQYDWVSLCDVRKVTT